MLQTTRRLVTILLLLLPACGGDDPVAPPAPAPDPVVDAALVGEWLGSIEGRSSTMSGSADIRFNLNDDGTMKVTPSRLPFHSIPFGSWGVRQDSFIAYGTDTEGNPVAFRASRSTTQLDGTWMGGGGSGTFDITRQ